MAYVGRKDPTYLLHAHIRGRTAGVYLSTGCILSLVDTDITIFILFAVVVVTWTLFVVALGYRVTVVVVHAGGTCTSRHQ